MSLSRTLKLLNIFKEKTNSNNKLTINDLIEYLKDEGYNNVSRNTIRSDINKLIDNGYNIIEEKCRYNTSCYFIESMFSVEESRIILDSIFSNKFINNDIRSSIKNKILSNISNYDRLRLSKSVTTETIDTGCIDIIKNLFIIHEAISRNLYIDFVNITRNINKIIIPYKDVKDFIPKEIYYYNNRYYLIGFNRNNLIRNYRIDRVYKIELKHFHNNKEKIELKNYGLINFDMFGAENFERIELEVNKNLINSVIEKFGTEVHIKKSYDNEKYFILSAFVGVNKGLLRWILKQGAEIKVIYPEHLIDEIKSEIEKLKNLYKK